MLHAPVDYSVLVESTSAVIRSHFQGGGACAYLCCLILYCSYSFKTSRGVLKPLKCKKKCFFFQDKMCRCVFVCLWLAVVLLPTIQGMALHTVYNHLSTCTLSLILMHKLWFSFLIFWHSMAALGRYLFSVDPPVQPHRNLEKYLCWSSYKFFIALANVNLAYCNINLSQLFLHVGFLEFLQHCHPDMLIQLLKFFFKCYTLAFEDIMFKRLDIAFNGHYILNC